MKPDWWPGEQHELFTEWAISQGIIVNGVAPARFPGQGLGMIATRSIKVRIFNLNPEGEAVLTVPLKAMFTIDCVPASFRDRFPEGTPIHAIFAAFLTHGDPEDLERYSLWKDTWPTRQDFEDSMPILWPQYLQTPNDPHQSALLPPSISSSWNTIRKRKSEYQYESSHQNLLSQQDDRLRASWEKVVTVFPDTDWEVFTYHWLIVNTRCFFYLMPGQEVPEDRNEAIAMVPFADYFNHADVVDDVQFDGKEYVFRATKNHNQGEEVYMSYGPHPNDFLFAEYGFFLNENESEAIYLDDIIFQDLSPILQEELNHQQYYGNYQLTSTGACYRTEIAACLKHMTRRDWRNYVLGYSSKGVDARKTEDIIREWIKGYAKEASTAIDTLEGMKGSSEVEEGLGGKIDMLLKRWRQIDGLCRQALETVSC